MSAEDRIELARRLYERAVFQGDDGTDPLAIADRELDGVEADLALARGRIRHTRFLAQRDDDPERAVADPRELALFERAAELYRDRADPRGEAEALFWIGCFHQVVRRDDQTAVPILERARALAVQAGDYRTLSEVLDLACRLSISLAFGLYARLSIAILLPVFAGCLALRVWGLALPMLTPVGTWTIPATVAS